MNECSFLSLELSKGVSKEEHTTPIQGWGEGQNVTNGMTDMTDMTVMIGG